MLLKLLIIFILSTVFRVIFFQFMTSEHQYISRKDEGDRMIVFERGDLVFVFNFHWTNSYSNYQIGCLKPGKYKVRLICDVWRYVIHSITSQALPIAILAALPTLTVQ